MTILKKLILICCLSFMSGCLYLNTKVPLDTDVSETRLGNKKGVSAIHSVLWLVSWGDGGTEAAARNGDIQTITHLDSEVYMVLFGLYTKVETIAYGD